MRLGFRAFHRRGQTFKPTDTFVALSHQSSSNLRFVKYERTKENVWERTAGDDSSGPRILDRGEAKGDGTYSGLAVIL